MRRQFAPSTGDDKAYLYMDQAGLTAGHWMKQSVEQIDGIFGDGYAKKNPALVAAFIQSAALDQQTSHLANTVCWRIDDIANSICTLAEAVVDHGKQ